MTYRGLLTLGGVEIANASRCATYASAGVAPSSLSIDYPEDGWAHTARFLGQQDYRLPALDNAPWYDPTLPDSKEFAGVWPMAVNGIEVASMNREAIDGLSDGGSFGAPRFGVSTIEVEALLIGASPQGVDYGLTWLKTALRGTRCVPPSGIVGGDQLQYLSSAPEVLPDLTTEAFLACVRPFKRTLYDVVCTSMPEITERFGGSKDGRPGASCYRVKFTLRSGVPFAYREPDLIVSDLKWNTTGAATPITWVVQATDPEACTTAPATVLTDPLSPPALIFRPADTYQISTRIPLDSRTVVATIPKTALKPHLGDTAAVMRLTMGAKEERLIRIRWGRKPTPATTTDNAIRCNLVSEASIKYAPPGSTIVLDAVLGRPWAVDSAGNILDASPMVAGTNGAPWKPPILQCGDEYVVVMDAPGDVSAAASVTIHGVVKET